MDKLTHIMALQADLQRRLGTDFTKMSMEERVDFMRNHRGYLADELAEAMYELPYYKKWKDYSHMSEEAAAYAMQKVRMELVDCLHFFINLLLCAGMTADEVYDMYVAKNKENHRRQDDGYTADKSYRDQAVEDVMSTKPTCTVAMDDETVGSNDFIAIINMPDGQTSLMYNTDVISLGVAIKMLSERYTALLLECPEELRDEVREVLTHG